MHYMAYALVYQQLYNIFSSRLLQSFSQNDVDIHDIYRLEKATCRAQTKSKEENKIQHQTISEGEAEGETERRRCVQDVRGEQIIVTIIIKQIMNMLYESLQVGSELNCREKELLSIKSSSDTGISLEE